MSDEPKQSETPPRTMQLQHQVRLGQTDVYELLAKFEELERENQRLRESLKNWEATAARRLVIIGEVSTERDQLKACARELAKAKRCPNCEDVGWYLVEGPHGEPQQEQCKWCDTTPDSRFNALAAFDKLPK